MKVITLFAALVFFISEAQSQTIEGCNFNTHISVFVNKSLSFKTQQEAEQVVRRILTESGFSEADPIPFNIVQKDNLGTCMATIINDQKTILYDPVFLKKVQRGFSQTNLFDKDWAAIFVMAHEVAHHLKGHLDKSPNICKGSSCEKSADDWAAFVLCRMGATLEETQMGIKTYIEKEAATPQYPSKSERLETVKASWERTKNKNSQLNITPKSESNNNIPPSVSTPEIDEGIRAYEIANYARAAQIFLNNQQSVEKNVEAAYYLGVMYDNGYSVKQDYAEAMKWYRKAAEQGQKEAQCNLGYIYQNGIGVEPDYNEAMKWYRKAAEQGQKEAQDNLGRMYQKGNGVAQDYNEAVKWFRKAAEQGYTDGQFNLGNRYENGEGVNQDYNEAIKWYRKAAEQGQVNAQNRLGEMYESGKGVPQNNNEAVQWYRKAAEQGFANGQYNLGAMYQFGLGGLTKDMNEATRLYRLAAKQDYQKAKDKLKQLGVSE